MCSTPSTRTRVIRYLTYAQHASAPFITTFVAIHLAAPILASVGGSGLSSEVMLLGREYYQGPLTEPLLVYTPLAVHLTASILKKALTGGFLKWPTLLGFSSMPLAILLPIHLFTHRLIPATPDPPISTLSPSELDYEYVKFGLATWPGRNVVMYVGMVACVVTHGIEGSTIILQKWVDKSVSTRAPWDWKRWTIAGTVVGGVAAGLWALKRETLFVPRLMSARMMGAWTQSSIYRI